MLFILMHTVWLHCDIHCVHAFCWFTELNQTIYLRVLYYINLFTVFSYDNVCIILLAECACIILIHVLYIIDPLTYKSMID